MRLAIFGSCVTRDVLNYDASSQIDLVAYYARSSFASAFSHASVSDEFSKSLDSQFQQRMVNSDLAKTFSAQLGNLDFDFLLIDLIDERFNLFEFNDGGICTISNELLATGFDPKTSPGVIVPSATPRFFELWESGWRIFIDTLKRLGKLDRVLINKVYWANRTKSGKNFLPTYSDNRIESSNVLLGRLYKIIAEDLVQSQFLEFEPDLLAGDDAHRWGLSPFHYIDQYYIEALGKLEKFKQYNHMRPEKQMDAIAEVVDASTMNALQIPYYLQDHFVLDWHEFVVGDASSVRFTNIEMNAVSGNCRAELKDGYLMASFSGGMDSYQLRYRFPQSRLGSGVGIRLRLSGWERIRYIGIGYEYDGNYRHVKIVNPRRNQWFDFSIGHGDIAYGLQNDWVYPQPSEIGNIRLYISGEPSHVGATVNISRMWCWNDATSEEELPAGYALPIWQAGSRERTQVEPRLFEIIERYLKKCFRNFDEQATAFMRDGVCPLYGDASLNWIVGEALPSDLDKVGTYRFSWHGLHPAMILILHARSTNNDAPLFAAREFVSSWLERSYFRNDPDKKFAWYDHGTAERLLAMVLLWAIGVERHFDRRFMDGLRSAIFRHGQLLDSEMFYASHQPTRYHNHAWFQDLALMVTALAIPDFPCADRWLTNALYRLTDQLETLIVRDGEFAVFVENSIGYHQGVQRLVEFAGELVAATGSTSDIPNVALELADFSEFFRYPDNRAPAQGDTFRRSNTQGDEIRRSKAYNKPSCVVLPKAGYGIIKGNHDEIPFMFSFFATSQCRTHKHEDNLSFTLFFDGLEWLIDPSFYSHEYTLPVPAYLRSAVAHNALVIPGAAYSIEPGVASIDGEVKDTHFHIRGEHRAYQNIVIRRHVHGSIDRLGFDFHDFAETVQFSDCDSANTSALYLMLHCGEQVEAILSGRMLTLSHPGSRFELGIELPSEDATKYFGVMQPDLVRGISGVGFMQQSSINSIECRVPFNEDLKWRIQVIS